eukprot:CAMPEP_0117524056 /NCGR_PEP_ID=MMETSP0784-20121206/35046_1 /TAXON_ID=39447 /ORGANISM="" /LENGTH=147 /DNA_ID=CAMNT_0005320187 /DNA_START=160 /DNA_END=600 /DNA_ORIENTATION=+
MNDALQLSLLGGIVPPFGLLHLLDVLEHLVHLAVHEVLELLPQLADLLASLELFLLKPPSGLYDLHLSVIVVLEDLLLDHLDFSRNVAKKMLGLIEKPRMCQRPHERRTVRRGAARFPVARLSRGLGAVCDADPQATLEHGLEPRWL